MKALLFTWLLFGSVQMVNSIPPAIIHFKQQDLQRTAYVLVQNQYKEMRLYLRPTQNGYVLMKWQMVESVYPNPQQGQDGQTMVRSLNPSHQMAVSYNMTHYVSTAYGMAYFTL